MTFLSATAKLGIAAETTPAVYAAPVFEVPFGPGTRFRDRILQLHDTTIRASDVTDDQDLQQGPRWSDWTVTSEAYTDWAGWLFRAMIGPDQYTPGTVTTFAASVAPGARSAVLAAAPPSGAVLQLGAGSSLEYAQAGTVTGAGPYTVPIVTPAAGLRFGHAAGDAAQSQARHLFQQARPIGTRWPSYSLTTDDGVEVLGWPGCILGQLKITVAADGGVQLTGTWNGYPPAAASSFAEAQTSAQPLAGWGWQITTAGGASTRGITLDLALTRPLDIIPCLNGQQAPLVIAAGPMKTTGRYKAIFDTAADLDLYRQALQQPAVWTFGQPVLQGGASIQVTLTRSGWTDGTVSLEEQYLVADFKLSGIANAVDSPSSGVAQASLRNWYQSSY